LIPAVLPYNCIVPVSVLHCDRAGRKPLSLHRSRDREGQHTAH
jgi:hypothetical protein